MLDKIKYCLLILLVFFLVLFMLALLVSTCIQLKSAYIDIQLKERLLYSGDSYISEVNDIG